MRKDLFEQTSVCSFNQRAGLRMKNYALCLSALIMMTTIGCFSKAVQRVADGITIDSGEIPPDMATDEFVVIGVLKGKDGYDKGIKMAFEGYSGEYHLQLGDDIVYSSAKASTSCPVSLCRYVIDFNIERYESSEMDRLDGFSTRFFIHDKLTGQTYTRKGRSSMFGKELQAYLKAIDRVRSNSEFIIH